MCLAKGHNEVTPVRLEPAATRSRVKHSTTGPFCMVESRYIAAESKQIILLKNCAD